MKIQSAAFITIASVVLSSVSPVLADTRDNTTLKERERILAERSVLLSDKEVNLEDQEKELNRKRAELNELAERLQREKFELPVREIELEDMRAKLSRDSELIEEKNRAYLKEKAELEEYHASVNREKEEAERTMTEAQSKLKLAEERENQTSRLVLEIEERERGIQDELRKINFEKAELLTREDKLKENEEEFEKKRIALEKRENDLKTAQKIFEDEKIQLEAEKTKIAQNKDEAERLIAEAREIMAKAEEKERQANEIFIKQHELEETIAKLQEDLKAKTDELDKLYQVRIGVFVAELPSDLPSNTTTTTTVRGIINWSDGSVRARGEGVVPPNKSEAQGEILARRAAVVDLQRNLLETVQGVQLDSKTTVEDAMTESDRITTEVRGLIRGVEVVEEKFENGKYIVWGQIRQDKMAGAMAEIVRKVKFAKKPAEPKNKTGNFTGLIIDATGLVGVQPRKLVRIVDEKGRIVYGTEYADRNIQITKGLCVYFDMMVFKDNEQERVGSNPLKVKAQRLSNENADIVIPNWAADEIRKNRIDFRKECRVIIVKS